MTSDHDHKELYFQIRENTKAVAELRTQVALMVQSVATVAKSLGTHVATHEKDASGIKSSAINAGFQLLVLVVAVVVGAAFLQWKGN